MRDHLKNKSIQDSIAVFLLGLALGIYSLIRFRSAAVQTRWILSPYLFPLLLSVFAIAATTLFALFGAAEYARIISETAAVNSEIDSYNEQISQLRKSQSSMNDFATINEICRERGMTMNWYRGEAVGTAPSETAPASTAPATPAPQTTEPNGE